MEATEELVKIVLVGVGATAVMDVWSMIQKSFGIPALDYAMVGRWVGHLCRGKAVHSNIGKADPIQAERPLGWVIHYVVGIAFAALLVCVSGVAWLHDPAWQPALIVGMVTVAVPFFVMQPGMGAGIAASRTPTPWSNRVRSLVAHAVFGYGLYMTAALLKLVW